MEKFQVKQHWQTVFLKDKMVNILDVGFAVSVLCNCCYNVKAALGKM